MSDQSPATVSVPRTRRGTRTNNACLRCRDRKVKCSGSCPCIACARHGIECVFDPGEKKVLISERYLNDLKRKTDVGDLRDGEHEAGSKRRQDNSSSQAIMNGSEWGSTNSRGIDAASPAQFVRDETNAAHNTVPLMHDESEGSLLRNILITTSPTHITDSVGTRRWLGPSSTWAYNQQVIRILRRHLNECDATQAPSSVDAQAFMLDWPSIRGSTPPQKPDLPSRDYAIYLTNTVSFHLGQTYHLFDEASFFPRLNAFYDSPTPLDPTEPTRLWHVHFFLVMALGQALLAPVLPDKCPAGNSLVARALDLLPDAHGLYKDPVVSIELLCCLGLYLQSIDHRNSAYLYIGQALRIAMTQGLHREPDAKHFSGQEITRLRSLWWTCYILDRKFSSLMGAPSSINDDDVTVSLPAPNTLSDRFDALAIHVRVSKLLANVLNKIYKSDDRLNRSVLRDIKDVLQETVGLSPELAAKFPLTSDHSGSFSRVSATLNLCFHQCVILAVRPILISLIEDIPRHHRNQHTIAGPIKAVIRTMSSSARSSLHILSSLKSLHLLEMFLPFDLEQAFSSISTLTLISALSQNPDFDYSEFTNISTGIFDAMISRGNRVAEFRRDDLKQLQEAAWQLNTHAQVSRAHPQNSQSIEDVDAQFECPTAHAERLSDCLNTMQATESSTSGSGATLGTIEDISITAFLEWEPGFTGMPNDRLPDDWLWADMDTLTFGYDASNDT